MFSLSLIFGLVAAVNVAVDPFGYFGFNRTGLFFDDERSFKLTQARRYPHDALLLGDSRTAYVNPEAIRTPRFFNGAFGGASFDEMVWFWEHYPGDARVVVVGVLASEVDRRRGVSEQFSSRSWHDLFRYALSFELLRRSYEAVGRWRAGEPSIYHENGSRMAGDKQIRDVLAGGQALAPVTAPFVPGGIRSEREVRDLCTGRAKQPPAARNVPAGYLRISRMAEIARRRNAKVILFLQPRHQTSLAEGGGYAGTPESLTSFACTHGIALFDLTDSYTDPRFYWRTDHTHYLPHVGVSLLVDVLRASNIPVELK